jgi:hypothetical protein
MNIIYFIVGVVLNAVSLVLQFFFMPLTVLSLLKCVIMM